MTVLEADTALAACQSEGGALRLTTPSPTPSANTTEEAAPVSAAGRKADSRGQVLGTGCGSDGAAEGDARPFD